MLVDTNKELMGLWVNKFINNSTGLSTLPHTRHGYLLSPQRFDRLVALRWSGPLTRTIHYESMSCVSCHGFDYFYCYCVSRS